MLVIGVNDETEKRNEFKNAMKIENKWKNMRIKQNEDTKSKRTDFWW